MAIVEVRRRRERDEKLSPVRVRPPIGHRQHASLVVPELRMKLVREVIPRAADALAQRIAALNHEAVDDAVKDGAVVVRFPHLLVRPGVAPLLGSFRQPDEVFHCPRGLLVEQSYGETAFTGRKLRVRCGQALGSLSIRTSYD